SARSQLVERVKVRTNFKPRGDLPNAVQDLSSLLRPPGAVEQPDALDLNSGELVGRGAGGGDLQRCVEVTGGSGQVPGQEREVTEVALGLEQRERLARRGGEHSRLAGESQRCFEVAARLVNASAQHAVGRGVEHAAAPLQPAVVS